MAGEDGRDRAQISYEERFGGPVAVLTWGGAQAVVALQGAQVLSYEPEGSGEVLWLSPQAKLGTGKAVRGGIPICWPWFGPHPEGGDRPAHGLARARRWTLLAADAGTEAARLTLALAPADLPEAHWPHATAVELDVALSETLTLSLTTRNLGAVEVSLTQALHSYFRVEEIADLDVLGLENIPFIDQLEPGALKTDSGPVRITREVDRIYQGVSGPITLKDGAARLIRIEAQGSSSAVLWNPWIEKSARLGDMGEDGYRRMVCVETANAGSDVIVLPGHASHTLTAIISASRPWQERRAGES